MSIDFYSNVDQPPAGSIEDFTVVRTTEGGTSGLRITWKHVLPGAEVDNASVMSYGIIIRGSDYFEEAGASPPDPPAGYLAQFPSYLGTVWLPMVAAEGANDYITALEQVTLVLYNNLVVIFTGGAADDISGYQEDGSLFIPQSALADPGPSSPDGPDIFDAMMVGIYAFNLQAGAPADLSASWPKAGAQVPEDHGPVWTGYAELKWEAVDIVRPHDWDAATHGPSLEDILAKDNMSCELVESHAFNRRAALVKVEMLSKLDNIQNNKDLVTGNDLGQGVDPYFTDDTSGYRKHKLFLNNITSIANRHAMYVENNPAYRANVSWAHWVKTASDETKTTTSSADSMYVAGDGVMDTQYELAPGLEGYGEDNVDGYKYLEKLFSDSDETYDKLLADTSFASVTPGASTNLSNLYCGQPAHVTIDCVNILGTDPAVSVAAGGSAEDPAWVPCVTEGVDPKYTGGDPIIDVHFRIHIPNDARGLSAASDTNNFAVFWKLVPKNSTSWVGATTSAHTPSLPTDYVFEDLLYDFNSKTLHTLDRVSLGTIATGASGYMPIGAFTSQPVPDDPYGPSFLPHGDAETWVGTATINLRSDVTARHTVWEEGFYNSGIPRMTTSDVIGSGAVAIANREFIIATVLIDISNGSVYTPWKEPGRNEYTPAYYKEFSLDAPTAVGIDIEPAPAPAGYITSGEDTAATNIEFDPADPASFNLQATSTYAWGDYGTWLAEATLLGAVDGVGGWNEPSAGVWTPPNTFPTTGADVTWSVIASPHTGVLPDSADGGTLDDIGTDGPIATLTPGVGYATWEESQPLIGVSIGDFDDGVFTVQAQKVVGGHTHNDTFTMRLQDRIVEVEFDVFAEGLSGTPDANGLDSMAVSWITPNAGARGLSGADALEAHMATSIIAVAGVDGDLNKHTDGFPVSIIYTWADTSNPHGDSGGNIASAAYSVIGGVINAPADPTGDAGADTLDAFELPGSYKSWDYVNGVAGPVLVQPKYKRASDVIGANAFHNGGRLATYNIIIDQDPAGGYTPLTYDGQNDNTMWQTPGTTICGYGTNMSYAFPPSKVATVKVMWAAAIFDETALNYWTEIGSTPVWDIYAKRTISETGIYVNPGDSGYTSPIEYYPNSTAGSEVASTNGIWKLADGTANNILIETNFTNSDDGEFIRLHGYAEYPSHPGIINTYEHFNWYRDLNAGAGLQLVKADSSYYDYTFTSDNSDENVTIICKHILKDGGAESNGTVGADWMQTVHIWITQICDQQVWKNFDALADGEGNPGVHLHWFLGDAVVASSSDNINLSLDTGPRYGTLDWDNPAAPVVSPGSVAALVGTPLPFQTQGGWWNSNPYYTVKNARSIMVRSPDVSVGYDLTSPAPGIDTWSWLGDTIDVDPGAWDQPTSVVIEWKTVGAAPRRYNTDPSTLPEDDGGFSISAINALLNTGYVYYDASNHAGYVDDGSGTPTEGNDYNFNKGEIRIDEAMFSSISNAHATTLLIPEFGDKVKLEGDITITKLICGHTYTDVVVASVLLYNWKCDNWNEYSQFDLLGDPGDLSGVVTQLEEASSTAPVSDDWDVTGYFGYASKTIAVTKIELRGDLNSAAEWLENVIIGGTSFGNLQTGYQDAVYRTVFEGSEAVDLITGHVYYSLDPTSTVAPASGTDGVAWGIRVTFSDMPFPNYLANYIEIGNTPVGASTGDSSPLVDEFKILPSGYIQSADAGNVTLQSGGTGAFGDYTIAPGSFGIESSHVTFEWHGQGWALGNNGSLPADTPWVHVSWISNFGSSVKRIFATGGSEVAIGSFSESAATALSSLVTYDNVTNKIVYSEPSFSSPATKQAFFDALDIPDWKDEGTYYGAAVVTYHPCMDAVETNIATVGDPQYFGLHIEHTTKVPLKIDVINSQCNAAWWSNNSISPPTVNGFNVAWFDDSVKTTTATLGVTIADGSGNNIITITGDETADIRIYDAAGTTYHDPFFTIHGGPLGSDAPPLNLLSTDFVFTWAGTPNASGASLLIDSVVAYEGGGYARVGRSNNTLWDSHLDGACHWQVLEELLSWDAGLASENSTVTYTGTCTLTVDVCGVSQSDSSSTVGFDITNNLGDVTATSNWHDWGFNLAPTAGGESIEINQPYNLTHDGEFLATDYPLPISGADGSLTVDTNTLGICMATTVGDAAEAPIATAIEKASGTPVWLPYDGFVGGAADLWTSGEVGGAIVTDSWNLTGYFKNMTGKVWISGIAIHGDLDGADEGLINVTIGGHLFGTFTTGTASAASPTAIVPGTFAAAYVDIVNGIVDYEFTVGENTGYLGPGYGNTHAWHMTVSFESPAVAQDDDHSDWVKICREIDAAAAPQGDAGVSNASEGSGTNGEDLTGAWVYIEDFLKFDGINPDTDYNTVSIVWWGDDCGACVTTDNDYGGGDDSYDALVRGTLNGLVGWDWLQASTSSAGPLKIDDLSVGSPKINGVGTYTFTELYQILEHLGFDASSTTPGHLFPIGSVKRFFGWIKLTKRCLGTDSTNDGSGVHDQTRYLPIRVDIKHALVDPFRCDYWIDQDGQSGPDYPVGLECNMTLGDWIASGNSTHTGAPPATLHPLLYAPPATGQDDVSDPDWGTTEDYGATPMGPGGVFPDAGGLQMVDGLLPVLIVKRKTGGAARELEGGLVHSIVWIDLRESLHPARTLIQKLEKVFIDEGIWDGLGDNVPWGGTASSWIYSPTIAHEVYHTGTSAQSGGPYIVEDHPANCYGRLWFLLCNVWTCGKPGINFKNTSGSPDVDLGLIPGLSSVQYPSRTHIGYKTFHPRGIKFDADGDGLGNGTDWHSPEYAEHAWMMPYSHYIPSYLIEPASLDGSGSPVNGWKDYAPSATIAGDLEVWGRACQLPATMDKNFVAGGTGAPTGSVLGEDWIGWLALEADMSRLWTDVGFSTQTGTAEALSPCCPCANLSALGSDASGTGDLLGSMASAFNAVGDWTDAYNEGGAYTPDSICYRIVLEVDSTGFYPSTTSMGYGYPSADPPPGTQWVFNGTVWTEWPP